MGRFFANQKLDAPGIIGITLQKLLIFFMVLDVISFFCGFGLFSSLMSLLFHFVVFMGVYRRRTAVLLLYVVFHVAFFILAAFALIVVVMYVQPGDYMDQSSYGSSSEVDIHYNSTSSSYFRSLRNIFVTAPNNTSSAGESSSDSFYTSSEEAYDQSFFLFSIIALLLSVVLLYCKILSVVLAHKMRKLLLAQTVLPVSRPETEVLEPTYIPADFDNNMNLFPQSGFAYQPMFQQHQQAMFPGQVPMPAPFMYGQQPVFYSYGPAPTKENNEKL
jgi:hypothetical protein